MNFKKVVRFLRKNPFLVIFFAAILFVGFVAGARLFLSKPTYVYAKVKVGQGLWWAQTQRPSIWQVDAINKGDVALGLLGNPEAEVLSKKVYRWYGSDQFDIYLTLKLAVSGNQKTGSYTFNRAALSVGSAIEIQFPKAEVTGTVIGLSSKPLEERLTEKTVRLIKSNAYPFEFDAIKIGDTYFDGEDKIFEVVDKTGIDTASLMNAASGGVFSIIAEPRMRIEVEAKVKVKNLNGQWVLGEDQLIVPGRNMSISTPNFVFDNYLVSRIE
ncbi:MAG: hypothetical protein A3C30_02950 [Candidatus Levybacteria bacterium RIFCSPHIGHO2_02_FULL_40_18]|nr:MAG: hypothetical protein A2869_05030 [Candidatus Levybacteria bacterium RIFCSPHIGHO2_01_FULL_40_58]OGH26933.1 MAG: hypothetical protein A3C30_02950 [Candidatus Levybacteria bacterium RIFCSPHIGHO2_02_FULL_40_18]OGH32055.1 MAG: hypothetical protein A3E43_03930 [Candidatus Levybacteria bacterium RIFCSPHIGHO2_12_FULL_40_31]OGH40823.1 MAG: hypothetical protein A2894_04470 [Candidatus Levybacteria bacterium RIFCSPLOWO2_01_FULL_40_64]OGH48679.1 MAG: hypothetical protein A3I54_03400 [Candidatus Lev